jgi:hypothetical protein
MPSLGAPVGQQAQPGGGDQPWSTGKKVAVVGAGVAAVAGVAYLASNKDGFGAIGQTLSKLF